MRDRARAEGEREGGAVTESTERERTVTEWRAEGPQTERDQERQSRDREGESRPIEQTEREQRERESRHRVK